MKLPVGKIICGDCLEVMKQWPDESIDCCVTSPPYDNLRDYEGFNFDFENIVKELYRVLKSGSVIVWVVGDAVIKGSETGTSFRQVLCFMDIGFNLHDTMIYQKTGFSSPSSNRYHQVFEFMFVFSKGKSKTFNPIKDRKNKWKNMGGRSCRQKNGTQIRRKNSGSLQEKYGMRFNIWKYSNGGGHVASNKIAHEHPAIFPEKLAIDHIVSWSNRSQIILDPFVGSGTTCVAAKMLDRKYIGIDISEKYCRLAERRLRSVRSNLFEKVLVRKKKQKKLDLFSKGDLS